ncbi:MAG: beta-lactamase family protein [Anaerolineales bacterium]|nr:beta-lactamase family protein [Anaerolineales bacterium]
MMIVVLALVSILLLLGGYIFIKRPVFLKAPKAPEKVNSLAEYEAHIDELIAFGDPPGMSLVVLKDGEIVHSKGYGYADAPNQISAAPEHVYHFWSFTKIVTATAIMQLVESGQIDLHAPVRDYLPEFEFSYPSTDSEVVTTYHLLTHSAGMGDAGAEMLGWVHYEGDAHYNQTEFLTSVWPKFQELAYEPGSGGYYSNIDYMMLSAVIEAVSGQSYESYVVENILQPLGMEGSGFEYTPEMAEFAAVGSHPDDLMAWVAHYSLDMDRAVREKADGRYWFNPLYSHQTGPTGLITSPLELTRFLQMLLNGGELDDVRILSEESVAMMNTPQVEIVKGPASGDDAAFGLGWAIEEENGRLVLTHSGSGMAYAVFVRVYPEENLAVVLAGNSTYLGHDYGYSLTRLAGSLDW